MRVQRARPDWTLMSELAQFPPDITLAVDGDGVIRTAMSADALADESIDLWRGMRWADTVPPEAAAQVAKAVEFGSTGRGILLLHRQPAAAQRQAAPARIYDCKTRKKIRLRRDRKKRPGRFRPQVKAVARPEGARAGLLEASRSRDAVQGAARRLVGSRRARARR